MSDETTFNPATYEKEINSGYNFQNCEVYPLQLKGASNHYKASKNGRSLRRRRG